MKCPVCSIKMIKSKKTKNPYNNKIHQGYKCPKCGVEGYCPKDCVEEEE